MRTVGLLSLLFLPALGDTAIRPYDGDGRYALDSDDGTKGLQGLTALAARRGTKPYDRLAKNGAWQTERVHFTDTGTGAPMVLLTRDRADEISYFKGNWSADGKHILFVRNETPNLYGPSYRPLTATTGPMRMNADGTGLRDFLREGPLARQIMASPVDADVCYAMAGTNLVAYSISASKPIRTLAEGLRSWWLKISLDGKYLCNADQGGKFIWVVPREGGTVSKIPYESAIHDSYQMHPTQPWVMLWYEKNVRTEGFVQMDLQGRVVSWTKPAFDWNHGDFGSDRYVGESGDTRKIAGKTWTDRELCLSKEAEEYYDNPPHYNAYIAWGPRDEHWAFMTRMVAKPHLSEVSLVHVDKTNGERVNRFRVCYTGMTRNKESLDRPNASPDGTKIMFNTNMFGPVQIAMAVAKMPEPPLELTWKSGTLSWKPAKHHRETLGYHVYRTTTPGRGYVSVTSEPIRETRWSTAATHNGKACGYAVTAIEHSGLESVLSNEVSAGDKGVSNAVFYAEPELFTKRTAPIWLALEGSASNLRYVWQRKKGATGTAELDVHAPKAGSYSVWARMKGFEGPARFGINSAVAATDAKDWTWVRAGSIPLKSGKNSLTLSSDLYGSALDCLCFSSDSGYRPEGRNIDRIEWPRLNVSGLSVQAQGSGTVAVTWNPVSDPTLHHYNLYASTDPDCPAVQANRVASPDRPPFLDWGAGEESLYYRLTAVDRAGNESPPTKPMPSR